MTSLFIKFICLVTDILAKVAKQHSFSRIRIASGCFGDRSDFFRLQQCFPAFRREALCCGCAGLFQPGAETQGERPWHRPCRPFRAWLFQRFPIADDERKIRRELPAGSNDRRFRDAADDGRSDCKSLLKWWTVCSGRSGCRWFPVFRLFRWPECSLRSLRFRIMCWKVKSNGPDHRAAGSGQEGGDDPGPDPDDPAQRARRDVGPVGDGFFRNDPPILARQAWYAGLTADPFSADVRCL